MWARVVEVCLGVWLALSPFIFRFSTQNTFAWLNAWACSFFLAFFSLTSFCKKCHYVHLLNLLIAFWLIKVAYLRFPQIASPDEQNCMVLGLLILMLSLVPNDCEKPPRKWRTYLKDKREP